MARSVELEFWLTSRGYDFAYDGDYPLARIDMVEAANNPARLGRAIDDTVALSIAFELDKGAPMEAIVVFDVGAELDILAGGAHRLAGNALSKSARTHWPAYKVTELDPLRRELLIRTHNIRNGRTSSLDERLVHIAEMKRLHDKLAVKDLAAMFGLKTEPVAEYLRSLAAERRADEIGILPLIKTKPFSTRTKGVINTIQSDEVFSAAVSLIAAHPNDFRASGIEQLVKEVREIRHDRRAIQFISDRDAELADVEERRKAKRVRTPSGRATKFMGRVRGLNGAYPGSTDKLYLEGLGSTCAEFRRELKAVDLAQDVLDSVRAALIQLVEQSEKQEELRARLSGKSTSAGTSPPPPGKDARA